MHHSAGRRRAALGIAFISLLFTLNAHAVLMNSMGDQATFSFYFEPLSDSYFTEITSLSLDFGSPGDENLWSNDDALQYDVFYNGMSIVGDPAPHRYCQH